MSQLKKLFFDKRMTDFGKDGAIAQWKLNPYKVFFIFIGVAILLAVMYAFLFTGDPGNFLGNLLFYAIVIIVSIAVIYLVASKMLEFRKLIVGFFIAFILIFVFYFGMGLLFGYFHLLTFQIGGYSSWILITALAGMGAKRIDGELDKKDVGYGLLVFVVLLGANIPIANGVGFLANVDALISQIIGLQPWKF